MLSKKVYMVLNLCYMLVVFTSGFVMLEVATAIDSDELKEVSTVKPIVYVDCPEVADLGEIIVVHFRVFNLTPTYYEGKPCGNLYGFEIVFQWNSTILEYINRTVKVPVETFPDGVLHSPVLPVLDEVDAAAGTYRVLYVSTAPAKPFNNPNASNTFFTMGFRVKSHGGTDLKLTTVKLADDKGQRIGCELLDGAFRTPTAPIARFTVFPDSYPVVNTRVEFNASTSYDSDGKIVEYIWDFGDGNVTRTMHPIISHEYKSVGSYKVKLRVIDDSGLSSPTYSKTLYVVQRRNLTVKEIAASSLEVYHGEQVTINVTVENNGDVPENFKVSLSYNTTADGDWTLIEEKEMSLPKGAKRTLSFTFNTSKVAMLNCSLFLLANATVIPHEENITDNILKTTKPIRVFYPLIDRKVHTIVIDANTYRVLTVSNGTVSSIDYSQLLTGNLIKFNVTGPASKTGYVNITIPKTLMWANPGQSWEIYVNNQPLPSGQIHISENSTHTSLYFTFTYPSEVTVKIASPNVIPEIPNIVLIILLIVTTVTATIMRKKRKTLHIHSFP